jgi:hypothetical protein
MNISSVVGMEGQLSSIMFKERIGIVHIELF